MPRFVGLDHVDAYFVANLHGDTCRVPNVRRNGRRFSNVDDVSVLHGHCRTPLSFFIEEESATAAQNARLADRFTDGLSPRGVSLVRAVLAGRSLHQIAADTGSSVQAISQRLARLRRRVPPLNQWWLSRHGARQGVGGPRRSAGQRLQAAPLPADESSIKAEIAIPLSAKLNPVRSTSNDANPCRIPPARRVAEGARVVRRGAELPGVGGARELGDEPGGSMG